MKLIKINNEYYLLNDDKIEENDWVEYWNSPPFRYTKKEYTLDEHCRKVIASTQKLDGLSLLDKSQILELLGISVDINKKAEEYSENLANETSQKQGFLAEYKQAIQDNIDKNFTLEDMKKMYSAGQDDCGEFGNVRGFDSMFNDIINKQIEWEVEIEMEVPVQVRDVLKPVVKIPKLTNDYINILSLK